MNRDYAGVYTYHELKRKHRKWCDHQVAAKTPEGRELLRQRLERFFIANGTNWHKDKRPLTGLP